MYSNTLRHRIVSSTLTLPFCAIVAAIVWLLPNVRSIDLWMGLAAASAMTYVLLELVNQNQLLRIRSRMISACFVVWIAATPFVHSIGWHFAPAAALLISLFILFSAYQKERAECEVFHAFLFLMLGSMVYPPLILTSVLLYITMGLMLRILTFRTVMASLLGMLLPLWLTFAWLFLRDELPLATAYLTPWLSYHIPDYAALPLSFWVNVCFITFQLLLGYLHYYRTNFNDKIRVRMCMYTFILLSLLFLALVILLPQNMPTLMFLLIMCSAPLVGHYYALARGWRAMTLWFLFNILLFVALGVYNSEMAI